MWMLIISVVSTLLWSPNIGWSAENASSSAPPRVYVGVYLNDVSNLSLGDGTYEVDADLWAKWYGDFDPSEIRFANASDIEVTTLETERDGEWHSARWRVLGTLRGDFPVFDFPFDRQSLSLKVSLPRHRGELIPDLAGSGVAQRFSITDWHWDKGFRPVVSADRYPSDLGSIAMEGRAAEVRSVSFEVGIARPITPVVLKLFLPLAVVALIVFLSLFVPPLSLQPRLTMCVTGLVACFAFQFSISDVMPSVAYLTLADKLFIIVYVMAILCVLVAVMSFLLYERGKVSYAHILQRVTRYLAPVAVIAAVVLAIPQRQQPAEAAVQALPERSLQSSSRDTLRIGTTTALRLASSPLGFASDWGLTIPSTQGRAQPLYLKRMPALDNEGMRFLSDGTLHVRWEIRDDARWSDGTPLTTDNILRPLELRPDPRIEEIVVHDEHALTLVWNARIIDALQAPEVWPTHDMHERIDMQDDAALRQYLSTTVRPTLGPYRITESDDQQIRGERNPYFPLAEAAIAHVEVRHYASSEALRAALEAADVDIITPNALDTRDNLQFPAQTDLRAFEAPGAGFTFIVPPYQDKSSIWNDATLRQMVAATFDRGMLAEQGWNGSGRPAYAPDLNHQPIYNASKQQRIEEARAYIETHAYNAEPVRLLWSAPQRERFVQSLALALEALGFVVEIQAVPSSWPLWISQDFDGLLVHQVRLEARAPIEQWWALPSENGRLQRSQRHQAWNNAMDELLTQYEHALFFERRTQLRERMQTRWLETLPLIPIAFAGERLVATESLQGWERSPDTPFGEAIYQWYFAETTPSGR